MNLSVSESAARRVRTQLQQRGHGIGLRLGVKRSGCSGYAYSVDYADAVGEGEQILDVQGVKIVVAEADNALLDGLRIDFRRQGLAELFSFDNPNATAECGCGESFAA